VTPKKEQDQRFVAGSKSVNPTFKYSSKIREKLDSGKQSPPIKEVAPNPFKYDGRAVSKNEPRVRLDQKPVIPQVATHLLVPKPKNGPEDSIAEDESESRINQRNNSVTWKKRDWSRYERDSSRDSVNVPKSHKLLFFKRLLKNNNPIAEDDTKTTKTDSENHQRPQSMYKSVHQYGAKKEHDPSIGRRFSKADRERDREHSVKSNVTQGKPKSKMLTKLIYNSQRDNNGEENSAEPNIRRPSSCQISPGTEQQLIQVLLNLTKGKV